MAGRPSFPLLPLSFIFFTGRPSPYRGDFSMLSHNPFSQVEFRYFTCLLFRFNRCLWHCSGGGLVLGCFLQIFFLAGYVPVWRGPRYYISSAKNICFTRLAISIKLFITIVHTHRYNLLEYFLTVTGLSQLIKKKMRLLGCQDI